MVTAEATGSYEVWHVDVIELGTTHGCPSVHAGMADVPVEWPRLPRTGALKWISGVNQESILS
jgi:hypothetical protein